MSEQAEGRRSDLWRSLQILSREEGVRRPNLASLLEKELLPLQRVWRIGLQSAGDDIRKAVSSSLYAVITQLEPRDARQPLDIQQRKAQYRYAVSISFNLIDIPELRDSKLQDRRSWLAKPERGVYQIAVTTSQRDLNHAIDQIEQALTTTGYAPLKDDSGDIAKVDEANFVSADNNPPLHKDPPASNPRIIRKRTVLVAALSVIGLSVAAILVMSSSFRATDTSPNSSPVNPSPIPASASSPPVQVLDVTEFRSIAEDKRYVLREGLTMATADLAKFNAEVAGNSEAFASWHTKHGGVALDFGSTNITLRGNTDGSVRITDMKVLKDCRKPINGTFLQGYTQGGGQETVKVGFDLDSPDPMPQEMAITTAQGLHPLGTNYFSAKTVSLARGEDVTLNIGAFTKQGSCTFKLRLIIATPQGSFSQDVDYHGKPFEVTAKAAPTRSDLPYSGYQAVYTQNAGLTWDPVDPATYIHR